MRKRSIIIPGIVIIIGAFFLISRQASGDSFPLPELGAKLRVGSNLEDLTYEASTVQRIGSVLHMKASSVVVNGQQCELGVVYTLSESAVESGETSWTKERMAQALKDQNGMPPLAKKLDDTYLVFEPSQAACALVGDSETLKKEGDKRKALWQSISTAEKNG